MTRITISLEDELYNKLNKEAKEEFRSLNQQVVKIVSAYYAKQKPVTRQREHFTDNETY